MLELHWTTDGERIASASPDKSVRVWDAATGSQVRTVPLARHVDARIQWYLLRASGPVGVGQDGGGANTVWLCLLLAS